MYLKFLSNGNIVFSFLDIEGVFVEEKITIWIRPRTCKFIDLAQFAAVETI